MYNFTLSTNSFVYLFRVAIFSLYAYFIAVITSATDYFFLWFVGWFVY